MNKDNNLRYLIKSIYRVKNNAIKISIVKGEKQFELDYHLSQEYSKSAGQSYYFGTSLNYNSLTEYLQIYKELLKVKRFLKNL